MLANLVLAALFFQAAQPHSQTMAVSGQVRVEISNRYGTITVRASDKTEVTVRANVPVVITRAGAVIEVKGREPVEPGPGAVRHFEVTVPAGSAVLLRGWIAELSVDGVKGPVTIHTREGKAALRNIGGTVDVKTTSGAVTIEASAGRIQVESNSGTVTVTGGAGPIALRSSSGNLQVRDARAAEVSATTVHGSIRFSGALAAAGRYTFSSHNGAIDIATGAGPSATFNIWTLQPQLVKAPGLAFAPSGGDPQLRRAVAGAGSAIVDIRAFSAPITIRAR